MFLIYWCTIFTYMKGEPQHLITSWRRFWGSWIMLVWNRQNWYHPFGQRLFQKEKFGSKYSSKMWVYPNAFYDNSDCLFFLLLIICYVSTQTESMPQWKNMYSALKVMKHRLPMDNSGGNYYHTLCCIIQDELQVIIVIFYSFIYII